MRTACKGVEGECSIGTRGRYLGLVSPLKLRFKEVSEHGRICQRGVVPSTLKDQTQVGQTLGRNVA